LRCPWRRSASLLPADPDLDQDEVRAVDGGITIVGQRQSPVPTKMPEHPTGESADDPEALGVDVEEDELIDRQARRSPREPLDQLRCICTAATDDGDLHAHVPIPLRGLDNLLITLSVIQPYARPRERPNHPEVTTGRWPVSDSSWARSRCTIRSIST
jgi:hypothetical protein